MREPTVVSTASGRTYLAVPDAYVERMAHHVRSLAVDGRGDDARGRHLSSLYALEWAYRHGLFEYRPSRDPARWMLLLLDVVGARAGLAPRSRLLMPSGAFLARMEELGLAHVAASTRAALEVSVAGVLDIPPTLAAPLLDRMSLAAVLWVLGVPPTGPVGREKHPQGRQIRKALRRRIDGAWETVLAKREEQGPIDAATVLAAVPTSFEATARSVAAALRRVDEDLAQVPFAVFYALLTDARRGGRVWRPPDCYVEGGSYDRATFDAMVGHVLTDARSRRRRYRRSSVLAELGLSASFPCTVARIDRWLAREPMPEFCLDGWREPHAGPDWHTWSRDRSREVERLHSELVDAMVGAKVGVKVGAKVGATPDDNCT